MYSRSPAGLPDRSLSDRAWEQNSVAQLARRLESRTDGVLVAPKDVLLVAPKVVGSVAPKAVAMVADSVALTVADSVSLKVAR